MTSQRDIVGTLESVGTKGGQLVLRGWVLAFDPITGFRVSVGHARLARVSWRYGLHNRNAKTNVGMSKCGFELRAPLENAARNEILDSLITVTPLINGRGNVSLFAIAKPSLPMPRKRDWPLVGLNFLPEACVGLGLLVNEARLGRDESVLDIGCGFGRMAYVLSYYLSPTCRYEGLEPVGRWVRWNRRILGSRFRNFRFTELPVRNSVYNTKGKLKATSVRFPYPDATFDLAFATSVFQHNQAAVVRHYLSEIARVLRPGGRSLITCFLLDAKPPRRPFENGSSSFPYALKDCWTVNPDLPETGIAFLESDFRGWAADNDLSVLRKLSGSWQGPGRSNLYQDMLILKKPGAVRRASRVV